MPTYLLDTCTISAMMHDDAGARRRMEDLGPSDRMVVCTIVRGEVLDGLTPIAPLQGCGPPRVGTRGRVSAVRS